MSEIRRVRADEWEALRDLRLRALADSPHAFATTLAEAERRSEAEWREAESGREAKFYALTKLGNKQLEAEAANWDRLSAAVGMILRTAE